MNPRRAALYLQIPSEYCRSFGRLRWAPNGDAVELLDGADAGGTFAFAAEIGQFLEGLRGADDWCPAFGTVLHLLFMLGLADRTTSSGRRSFLRKDRLARPFRELGNPLRNAGALFARLLADTPGFQLAVADPPELSDILMLLGGGSPIPYIFLSHPMLGATDYAEQPAVDASRLDAIVNARLDDFSDRAIRHWLTFGRGPLNGLDDVEIPLPPGALLGSLRQVEERPRLAGLTRLVGQLEGALSLPPRRLEDEGPEADGYWDLTTRGAPEQILPIQFALENEEFLRRFAERELLYFHRERPSRPVVQELVLLLDQGVRTWGDVRLVLAGAAVALVRQAGRRKLAVALATTGDDREPVDPAELSADAVGQFLEASDLSPNPARALDRVLRNDAGCLRDVVVLTHPRSLAEPALVEAAARPGLVASTRIFAVTVDVGGEVELVELRHGRPVRLSRCRVDLSEPGAPPPVPRSRQAVKRVPWRGDVAPIPFPFPSGLLGPLAESDDQSAGLVDFDEAGGRVFVALRHGMVCACRLDGGDTEILPRAVVKGELMKPATGVIGVSGGVVLLSSRQDTPVLAHYDFATRLCSVHQIPPFARGVGPTCWSYYPDLHSLGGRPADRGRPCMSVDLSASGEAAIGTPRASAAAERARAGVPPYPAPGDGLETHASEPWTDLSCHDVVLDASTGTLTYRQGSGAPRSLTPMSDGHPALKGTQIASTLQGGDVLGVQIESRSARNFWFISMSRCAVIGSFCYDLDGPTPGWFALSRDGRRFARRTRHERIEIRDVPGDRAPVLILQRQWLWHHFASLGRSCLLVREFDQSGARRWHAQVLVRWDVERLTVDYDDPIREFEQLGGVVRESRSLSAPTMPRRYDRARFVQFIEHGELRFLFDRYNQVAVLGRDDRLVAMFYTSGREFAAWLPDGTCAGSARLIGGEPSKGAAERIAVALRVAERGEGVLR